MQTRLAHDPVREKAQLQQQHKYIDAPIIRTCCASYRVHQPRVSIVVIRGSGRECVIVCTRRKYVVTAIDVLSLTLRVPPFLLVPRQITASMHCNCTLPKGKKEID